MRKAVQDPRRVQVSRTATIPAPIGGWDAQSALADMPLENAVILDNFIPRAGYVELRKGSFPQATNIATGTVQTLWSWRGTSDKLRAAAGTSIYDVTSQGISNPSALYSSATVATWQWVNFANDAGTWVIAVNGSDTPVKDDGTSITTTAFTGTAGPITLDPTKLSLIMAHKRRLHMGQKNSLFVWFPTSTDSIAGACGLLDLGPVFTKGGVLVAMGTTSLNYGTALDDFAIYVTSQGQIAMYQGTDPGDADNWALVGVYDVGYPLGPRSLIKYGSDLGIITTDGLILLSQAVALDRAQDNAIALTQKIQNAFHTATLSYPPGTFGWEGSLYPTGSLAIINVPTSPATQFVQNVQTGAWCRFTGMDATCWTTSGGLIYFGSGNAVYQWDLGADDSGSPITYDLKGAFSDLKYRGQKRFTAIRALIIAPSWIKPALEVDVNYADAVPVATEIVVDVSELTGVARYAWTSASGIGFVGAPRMRIMSLSVPQTFLAVDSAGTDTVTTGDGFEIITQDPLPEVQFQLTSFDLVYEPGGVL